MIAELQIHGKVKDSILQPLYSPFNGSGILKGEVLVPTEGLRAPTEEFEIRMDPSDGQGLAGG